MTGPHVDCSGHPWPVAVLALLFAVLLMFGWMVLLAVEWIARRPE